MKYCIDFQGKQLDIFDEVDEINIDVLKTNLTDLKEYCELHKNQRINLCINDYDKAIDDKKLFMSFDFQKDNPSYNVKIRLPEWNEEYFKELKKQYPESLVYFKTYMNNWDSLYRYLDLGVSDVYITEQLGFELDKVSTLVHEKNAQVRVFPNVAQCGYKDLDDIYKFWIRPEDVEDYEPYIDVFEFFGEEKKQELYYSIYANDKKWMGDLAEIIIDLNGPIDSTCLVPRFCKKRIICGRKCMKGDPCRMCHHILDLAQSLGKTDLRIVREDFENGTRSDSESRNTEEDIK